MLLILGDGNIKEKRAFWAKHSYFNQNTESNTRPL